MTAFAQDALSTEDLAEARTTFAVEHHMPEPYLTSIARGGPIYQAAHLLMLACFIAVLVMRFRRASGATMLVCSFMPCVFGAVAMWISVLSLTAALSGYHFDRDVLQILRGVPRPFYLGLALSGLSLSLAWRGRFTRTHDAV